MVGQVGSTADCAHTGCLVAVLDGDRQAVQGAEVISTRACGIRLFRRAARSVRVDRDNRVERGLCALIRDRYRSTNSTLDTSLASSAASCSVAGSQAKSSGAKEDTVISFYW